jgi:putative nucleotidyltransferase with HDIG domain
LKLTNDIFGHAFGDILLQKVAAVMHRVCRADDIIARWGGDEFVLLLPKTGPREAAQIIERIKAEFTREQVKALKGSISLGTDTKQDVAENIIDVLNRAEERMYAAKTLERDRFEKNVVENIMAAIHESCAGEKEHSLRVSALCQKLGKAVGLPEEDMYKLKAAAYLHDIGKIVLDTKLIGESESMQLSSREWEEMRKHPAVGFRILNSFDDMLTIAEPVLAHHEHWDGSGYPKGLKGEQIPYLARIIAIVNYYDRKAYSVQKGEAMGKEEALRNIRDYAGSRFDPCLAAVFAKMMEEEPAKQKPLAADL